MLVENYIGEQELDQCKAGFTWKYVVEEKVMDGGRQTVISGEVIHKSASGITFGMPYPFDSGRKEDRTVDAIRETMLNLRMVAAEVGVAVREIGSGVVIEQGVSGKVVQDFISELSRVDRVVVIICK